MSGGVPSSIKRLFSCAAASLHTYVPKLFLKILKGAFSDMYQALYRKWRPLRFSDVLSQPLVTTTLQNQLRNGTTAHAYLFTGSRGTGKTTCARILAKAVNCEHPLPDGNPCLECSICKDAEKGILSDIVEIDAASNNSVEDVRDLRDGAVYTPERCRYKIYIIDEVHMLSTSAFNALLKIMEEPPPYVKFILATTEIHKVPATIISRCQRYDFRRIRQEDLIERICYIAGQENISIEPEAAALMARLSDGGMRDAISLLDRCSASGETITVSITSEAAGTAGREYLLRLLQALYQRQIPEVLNIIAELHDRSKDLRRLCEELILMQRDIMILKVSGDRSLLQCMNDEIPALQALTEKQDMQRIMTQLSVLQKCLERMSRAVSPRAELEMILIHLCNPQTMASTAVPAMNPQEMQAIYQRLAQLEQNRPANQAVPEQHPLTRPQASPEPDPPAEVDMNSLQLSDFQPVAQWAEILEECGKLNPAVVGTLAGSTAVAYANIMLITTENSFFMRVFRDKENVRSLSRAIFNVTGKRYVLRAKCSQEAVTPRPIEEMMERAKNSGIKTTAVT